MAFDGKRAATGPCNSNDYASEKKSTRTGSYLGSRCALVFEPKCLYPQETFYTGNEEEDAEVRQAVADLLGKARYGTYQHGSQTGLRHNRSLHR